MVLISSWFSGKLLFIFREICVCCSFGEVNEVRKDVGSSEQPGDSEEFENSTQRILPKRPCFISPSRGPKNNILVSVLIGNWQLLLISYIVIETQRNNSVF